jgi:hypothetical protein
MLYTTLQLLREECRKVGMATLEDHMEYELNRQDQMTYEFNRERICVPKEWTESQVGGYLTIMRKLLTDAEAAWVSGLGDKASLDEIRQLVAVGTACMEQHGAMIRDPEIVILWPKPDGTFFTNV